MIVAPSPAVGRTPQLPASAATRLEPVRRSESRRGVWPTAWRSIGHACFTVALAYWCSRATSPRQIGLERRSLVDTERERELNDVLAGMRSEFANMPEEQLMQDVADIIEYDRQEERRRASAVA